jgi:hypothetical protein
MRSFERHEMKYFALIIFLIALPVRAEWVKYGEDEFAIYYLDPSTIRKKGQRARVWEISDYK